MCTWTHMYTHIHAHVHTYKHTYKHTSVPDKNNLRKQAILAFEWHMAGLKTCHIYARVLMC